MPLQVPTLRFSDAFSLDFRVSELGEARIRELQEGPICGAKLYADGYAVLHGSCVNATGKTVAFVGPSVAGKSTLAACFCLRGAQLVSDGMTAVHPETLKVVPGLARTKLNGDSLRLLGVAPNDYALVHPESEKRYFPVSGVDCALESDTGLVKHLSYPLSAIFIIEDGQELEMTPIEGAQSLVKLMANSYLAHYLHASQSSILMQRVASLIQNGVQVRTLRRLREPSCLLETVEAIEREVSKIR